MRASGMRTRMRMRTKTVRHIEMFGMKAIVGRKKRRDLFQEASEASSVVDYHIDTQVQAVQVLF